MPVSRHAEFVEEALAGAPPCLEMDSSSDPSVDPPVTGDTMLPLGTAASGNRSSLRGGREQGLKLYELLAVVVTVFCVAVILVTILRRTPSRAEYRVFCAGHLRELGKLGSMYADSSGTGIFPLGDGQRPPAHESLNRMVRFYGSEKLIHPVEFICPTWREGEPAVPDEDGKYELDAKTNSYAWATKKLSPTGPVRPLASDKYYRHGDQLNGHEAGMNVLYTDNSVEWTPTTDLPIDDGLPEGLVR